MKIRQHHHAATEDRVRKGNEGKPNESQEKLKLKLKLKLRSQKRIKLN